MKKYIIFLILLSIILVVAYPKIMNFIFSSDWKTQEIIYKNIQNPKENIQFQMQDIGALGYNKRIVKVKTGLFFNSYQEIDTLNLNKEKWKRVNIFVNELNLKIP